MGGKKSTVSQSVSALNLVQVTYLCVDPLEGGVILVHLEVDLRGGDGQSPPGHQDGGDELGRAAQDHWACRERRVEEGGGSHVLRQ